MTTHAGTLQQPRFLGIAQFARSVAVVAIAGGLAGLVVGGLGSRIAMRISGALTDNCAELITGTGFPCGEVTVSGTVPLLAQGVFMGVGLGGLLYLVARPWLQLAGRWHGLVFGMLLLLVFGSVDIRPGGSFDRFATPWLNVALFALLPLLFGMALSVLVQWADRALVTIPAQGYSRNRRWTSYVFIAGGSAVALFITGVLGLALFATATGAMEASLREMVILGSFSYLLVFGAVVRTTAFRNALRSPKTALAAGGVVLAVPVAVGGMLTIRAIGETVGLL